MKTQVEIPDNAGPNEVTAEVNYDFELIVPVVNRVIALGEDLFDFSTSSGPGEPTNGAEELSRKYGAPHILISDTCVLPRPWPEE